MTTLWIFNPDTEDALGAGGCSYTPKKDIKEMRRQLTPLASLFADPDSDRILLLDDPMPPEGHYGGVKLVLPSELSSLPQEDLQIRPWGWNPALVHWLKGLGVDEKLLPSPKEMEDLRRLAHRRFTIEFNKEIGSDYIPEELKTLEEVKDFFNKNEGCFLKLPWSCSGRGTLKVKKLGKGELHWITTSLANRGSIMAETIFEDKTKDFATEWECRNGEVIFRGFSSFQTFRGKYSKNFSLDQEFLYRIISSHTDGMIDFWVEKQGDALQRLVAPFYSGPVGIDMMSSEFGETVPCVELNFRITMGMAAIQYHEKHPEEPWFDPKSFGATFVI